MRRTLVISGIAAGAIIVIAAALVAYAFFNLSSIVASNQKRILARVSNELGRRVEVAKIQAHMGLGVSVEVSGLKIADDPAFSTKPFVAANDVSVEVEFLPLLGGEAKVTRLDLIKPDIRIVRNANGDFNIESIGSNAAEAKSPNKPRARKRSSLAELSIKALSVEDGAIYYNDLAEKAAPIKIHHLDFDVTNFSAVSAFDVEVKLAFSGDEQNVEASGKLGPLLRQGFLDASGIPVDIKLNLDSILLDRIRTLTDLGAEIPSGLELPDPVSVGGTLQGTIAKLAFAISTDLTANRVAYVGVFDKPAGTGMTLKANGTWTDQLEVASANLKLADLEMTASRVSVGGPQPLSAQIDTNSFNLANLGPMLPAAAGYGLAGISEIHGSAKLDNGSPVFDATVTLKQVGLKLPSVASGITDLNGTIRLADGREVIEPTTFSLGSAHANLQGQVDSVSPLKASYALKADSIKLAEIFPSRPAGEVINQLVVNGTADGVLASPRLTAKILSADGSLQNISYRNFDLTAAYKDSRVSARPFNVNAFGGSLEADADAVLGSSTSFNATLGMRNLNVEQALRSQAIDAANTVHGFLTGNVAASGAGANWDRIKPSIRGSGRLALSNGKLVGVNIVADAINAVAAAPGVSQLMNVAFMSSHHGLLMDPDTELQAASMSFQLAGPRFTTHDFYAQSPDYRINGEGWFDMDKNIDMSGDIQLSLGLQVAIPVTVSGKLPGLSVLPDVPQLAERVAMGAINTPGNIIRGGVNAVGNLIGGGGTSGKTTSSSIPNPINMLKKFIP